MKLTAENLRQAEACEDAIEMVRLAGGTIDTDRLTGRHPWLVWLKDCVFYLGAGGPRSRVEYSSGWWEQTSYDTEGRVSRVEYSSGWWEQTSYDTEGRVSRVEYSSGGWEQT